MEVRNFKLEALEKTLALMDNYENWITFNQEMNSRIIYADTIEDASITLLNNELPIFECKLEDSYMLITTKRVISKIDKELNEIYLKDVENLGDDNENYQKIDGEYPGTNLIIINGCDNKKLILKVDSHHPSYFTKMIILNLSTYLNHGKWFMNPSKKWGN